MASHHRKMLVALADVLTSNGGFMIGNPSPERITGVPSLLMGHDTTADARAARIIGLRQNQLIRAVKECSNRIYRQAVSHIHIGRNEKLSKSEIDSIQASVIFSDNALRRLILEEHARASFSPSGKPERIPVLEYALLKSWKPEMGSLQRGEYNPLRRERPPSSVEETVKNAGAIPFLPSQVELFFFKLNSKSPWITEEVFAPLWLIPMAEQVLRELARWDELDKPGQAGLAGAAYAVASAVGRARMLIHYLDVEPRLGLYLQGVSGLTPDDEPWDGSVWERKVLNKAQSQLILGVANLTDMQRNLIRKWEPGTIALMRELINSFENIVFSVAAHAVGEARMRLAENKALLEKMILDLSVTGRTFDFSTVIGRITMWIDLLSDERMERTGAVQNELLNLLRDEVSQISQTLPALVENFEAVSHEHQSILAGGLTWQQQTQRMQELNRELDAFEVACQQFNSRFDGRKKPTLPAENEGTRDQGQSELELARLEISQNAEEISRLEEEVADLKLRIAGLHKENDSVRQENAELHSRIEALQLVIGGRETTGVGPTTELYDAIDGMIERADAPSVLRLLQAMYPERIRFFESAYKSAGSHTSIPITALYQRIKAMATQGLDRLRETGRLISLRDVVPGDITIQESDTVKNNPRLRSMRSFRDGDKERLIFPHLSIDYSHRLYFDYDAEEDRILIAYAGKHLPSAKNSTV